jgi:hypothetical protein
MYKHAPTSRRPASHDPDPGQILHAAGVEPPGTPEFVRQVKLAVQKDGSPRYSFFLLARYLNGEGIRNARGYPWTPDAIEAFMKCYMPKGREISN